MPVATIPRRDSGKAWPRKRFYAAAYSTVFFFVNVWVA